MNFKLQHLKNSSESDSGSDYEHSKAEEEREQAKKGDLDKLKSLNKSIRGQAQKETPLGSDDGASNIDAEEQLEDEMGQKENGKQL